MWIKVKAITFNRFDKYFDTTVPKYHNYIGNGILNHNSGKDSLSSIAMVRTIYRLLCHKNPQNYFGGLDSTSPIDFVNIARSANQAKNVYFGYLKNMVKKKKFWKYFGTKPEILQGVIRFPKNITCYSGHSKSESLEGYSPFMYILDEISAFPGIDELNISGKNIRGAITSAEYIDSVLRSSMTSRFPKWGIGLLLSYPRYKGDPIQKAYEQGLTEKYTFCSFGCTWEVNLSKKKEDFEEEFKKNYEDAQGKYACNPMAIESAFLKDKQAVLEMFDPYLEDPIVDLANNKYGNWFKPGKFTYAIHVDLALSKDSCGFVLAHLGTPVQKQKCSKCGVNVTKEDLVCPNCGISAIQFKFEYQPTIVVDIATKISPPHKGEIQISDMIKRIIGLKDAGFQFKITFDQYQSASSIQLLKANGLDAELKSVDRTVEPYETLKELIYDRRIKCYEYEPLKRELETLVFTGKKVDHLMGHSKDVADALAGAVHTLITQGKRFRALQDLQGIKPIIISSPFLDNF